MSAITNLIIRLQRWMDSVPGQTFLNYTYSWGASIVILGALFKLTHLPGGNLMLFIGMGTEVVVFFISAFDRPFDKQEIGKELPRTLKEVREVGELPSDRVVEDHPEPVQPQVVIPQTVVVSPQPAAVVSQPVQPAVVQPAQPLSDDAPVETGNTTPELAEATTAYVEKLRSLTETLSKVEEQSQRMGRDSEEMGELNRTLTAITKAYEMQLRGVSGQMGTIDEINRQIEQLAQQLASLNSIYSRMIAALSVQAPTTTANGGI